MVQITVDTTGLFAAFVLLFICASGFKHMTSPVAVILLFLALVCLVVWMVKVLGR